MTSKLGQNIIIHTVGSSVNINKSLQLCFRISLFFMTLLPNLYKISKIYKNFRLTHHTKCGNSALIIGIANTFYKLTCSFRTGIVVLHALRTIFSPIRSIIAIKKGGTDKERWCCTEHPLNLVSLSSSKTHLSIFQLPRLHFNKTKIN